MIDRAVDVLASGAVVLGPNVVCDGFLRDRQVRVQTHIHSDHLEGFESSKGYQEIVLTAPTRRFLETRFNADLPYRANIVPIGLGNGLVRGSSKITLRAAGHMLGAAQVEVELEDGDRLGYSGDFSWPLDDVIQVDALVVDSTYGSPRSVRNYSQDEAEDSLLSVLHRALLSGPVHLFAHRGTLQRALQLLDEFDCPLIGTRPLLGETQVFREAAYPIPKILDVRSSAGESALCDGPYIRLFGAHDRKPVDDHGHTTVTLSAYFTDSESPIKEYSDRAVCVALSDHADFYGTLDYIAASGAGTVVTDNTRGRGIELAQEIRARLNIDAFPSSNRDSLEWGT